MSLAPQIRLLQRRTFLGQTTRGLGAIALASLLKDSARIHADARSDHGSGAVSALHWPAKAKRVIFLCMAGGPSHLETFDYKPKLAQMHGDSMPESFTRGQPIAQLQGKKLKCFAPQHPFAKFGRSQQEICTLFPHIGSI